MSRHSEPYDHTPHTDLRRTHSTGTHSPHAPGPYTPGPYGHATPGSGSGPYDVRRDDLRIPLHDGVGLHARVWRPRTDAPVPVLLEYAPGRLTDATAARDAHRHPWYATHGYASVRVDARGHGSGEGLPAGPWGGSGRSLALAAAADAADAAEVVEWLAALPWSDGRIGMFGLGPGAGIALRAAALAPVPLRAVVAVDASLDPYREDGALLGGAVAADALPARSTALLAALCAPPDPRYAGDHWRELWAARTAAVEPPLYGALAHQLRDDHWNTWSPPAAAAGPGPGAGPPTGSVRAAVLAVSGWHSPYRDTVLRLLETLPAGRVRGLIGPWAHHYPDEPGPGPAIGFHHETLRWWDRHLRAGDPGPDTGPALLVQPIGPGTGNEPAGRWLALPDWPSPAVRTVPYALRGAPAPVRSPQHTGADAGRPLSETGRAADLPPDQREEDARSVCFEFPVPGDGVTVLGRPRVTLRLRMDVPYGQLAVRLCDLAPGGESALITRGVLNLAARHGAERARAWTPGATEDVELTLAAAGYSVPPGHRIRLAVSSAYWPWVWPAPGSPAGFVLLPEGSRLDLPVYGGAPDPAARPPDPAEGVEPLGVVSPAPLTAPEEHRPERMLTRDLGTDEWRLESDPRRWGAAGASRVYPDGLEVFEDARELRSIRADDPLSARAETAWTLRFHRPELAWDITVEARSVLSCDAADFIAEDEVICREHRGGGPSRGEAVFHRTWVKRFPRMTG
ncbi:CocE/NonD family hydrolase [Streptomyces qinzhouensis]|uniref:CocE/NonD family hydrolase n=1 Tax=Streptomyces qinzhouensis TaxID=2599401 RepID=A0A5B8JDN0_9ACTN|nr:CocE/NonD family hydrolase [Streptomyces qinzhouensis]QDY78444.1 CocE/NonD family hydrolase [Streptomyces qinzhouensis]